MSLIFEETKTLTPNDTKTNVPLQFYVAEELEKMKIEFSYSPKNLDDEEKAHKYIDDGFEKYAPEPYRKGYKPWYEYLPVKNLLTVSLDSPDGYIVTNAHVIAGGQNALVALYNGDRYEADL